MASNDQFWGFLNGVADIAGDIFFALLLAEPDGEKGGARTGKTTVFSFGDGAGEECYFSQDNQEGTVLLNNTSSALTCTCTFSVNTPNGPKIDYLVVPPNSSTEVTSYFQEYMDGGSCGLNAISAPPSGLPGISFPIVATIALSTVAVGSAIIFTLANLSIVPQANEIVATNNSTVTYNCSLSLNFLKSGLTLTTNLTVGPNSTQSVQYPNNVVIPANEEIVDEVRAEVSSQGSSLQRRPAGRLGDTSPFGPYYLQQLNCPVGMVLTAVGTNLQLAPKDTTNQSQQWTFTPVFSAGGQYYSGLTISPVATPGYCVQFNGNSNALTLASYDASNVNQVWLLTLAKQTGGAYIESWASVGNGDSCFNAQNNGCTTGTIIQGYKMTGGKNEQWELLSS